MLKAVAYSLRRELKVYRLLLKDSRIPRITKITLGLAIGYALLPFDFIPDCIPILGYLDDLIIVSLLIIIGLKFIPTQVIEECRTMVASEESEHGIWSSKHARV